MIKTVSFAPPRASGSRSGAKATGAKTVPVEALRPNSSRPASGRKPPIATAQTSLELLFDAPEPVAAPAPEPVAAPVAVEPKTKIVKKAAKAEQPATTIAAPIVAAPIVAAPIVAAPIVAAPIEKPVPVAATGAVKAKKPRVPKDLAAQYGEKVVERVIAPPVEAEIVKKRLNKEERQARRDLIKPSSDLLERLARLNQIGARKPKSEPRGKGWKFQCGRCGVISFFETPGGLCACGTIAVKE